MDVLEIEVEDVGGTSLISSLLTTLGTQHGVAYQRFVGRAYSDDPRWPTYLVVGGTFPTMRAPLDDLQAQGAWVTSIQEQLAQLRQRLAEEGWRPAGQGAHWWSYRYTRPGLDTTRHRTPTSAAWTGPRLSQPPRVGRLRPGAGR